MYETSKSVIRRGFDRRYVARYLVGRGIDIGAGADSIGQYRSLFPLMRDVKAWDLADGDAMLMDGVSDESYDFVHSSHCLEHLIDPNIALKHWIRICKKGGYLLITVPDEDLYEQGVWPSTYNTDHKWTFTIAKQTSWSLKSVNVFDLLRPFLDQVQVLKIELLDAHHIYGLSERFDQTLTLTGESAIEIVLRKI